MHVSKASKLLTIVVEVRQLIDRSTRAMSALMSSDTAKREPTTMRFALSANAAHGFGCCGAFRLLPAFMAMVISDLSDGVAIVRNTSQFGDAPDRPLSWSGGRRQSAAAQGW